MMVIVSRMPEEGSEEDTGLLDGLVSVPAGLRVLEAPPDNAFAEALAVPLLVLCVAATCALAKAPPAAR